MTPDCTFAIAAGRPIPQSGHGQSIRSETGTALARPPSHLPQAMTVPQQLTPPSAIDGLAWDLLEALRTAVIVIDATCHLLWLNRAAATLVAAEDGLSNRSGRLVIADQGAQRSLNDILTLGIGARAGVSRALRADRSKGAPYIIELLQLQGPPRWTGGNARVWALFLNNPAAMPQSGRALRDLFGLTQAELRLALQIGGNETLPHLAESLGISLPTARTHLAHIFAKTGVRGQAALGRLVERCSLIETG